MVSVQNQRELGIYYTPLSIAYYATRKSLKYYLNADNIPFSSKELTLREGDALQNLRERIKTILILDPACGNGVFLKVATSLLYDLTIKLRETEIINNTSQPSETDVIQQIIKKNIFGIDINQPLIEKHNQEFLHDFQIDFQDQSLYPIHYGNFLIENSISDSFYAQKTPQKFIEKNIRFDLILGNPPWGADLSAFKPRLQQKYPSIAQGQFDSFAIFLYKSIEYFLKDDGIIAFLIPNEICFLDQYKSLRKYLLKFTILELINLGFEIFPNVQKPALLLILQKSPPNPQDNETLVSVDFPDEQKSLILDDASVLEELIKEDHYIRFQSQFSDNRNYILDIFSDPLDRKLMQIIHSNHFHTVGDYFYSGRGIDTNKTGKYFICPKCDALNPPFGRGHSGRHKSKPCQSDNCDFLFKKLDESVYETIELISEEYFSRHPNTTPGYIGEDLGKLHFRRPPRTVVYGTENVRNFMHNEKLDCSNVMWGRDELYYGEKLLIRKVSTNHNLQIMFHPGGKLVTNQQIYIFKKKDNIKHVSLYYILGILISHLIHYYYINKFGDPYKKVLPHFTQSNLKALPIPLIYPEEKRYVQLIFIVKELLKNVSIIHTCCMPKQEKVSFTRSKLLKQMATLYSRLDSLVFSLYNISDEHMQEIIIQRADAYGFRLF
jgi:hypothetical protein